MLNIFKRRTAEDLTPKIRELETELDDLRLRLNFLESQSESCNYLPVPPLHLRSRVGLSEKPNEFLVVGRNVFGDLERLLKDLGRPFDSFESILDFGCGCGRVSRYLKPKAHQRIVGVDIDPEAINWCEKHLNHIAKFDVGPILPPLPYADSSFDLIYVVSVFTHLPEDMQFKWLRELKRLLKTGGLLIASYHGPELLQAHYPEKSGEFEKSGFLYVKGVDTPGLPEFYQCTFHSPNYMEAEWGKLFTIRTMQTHAINKRHDAIVCEKI